MKNILSVFKADKGSYSSKRVCGVLSWFVVMGCYTFCCCTHTQMPEVTEFIVGASVTLLGIDPVTSIFKSNEENKAEEA